MLPSSLDPELGPNGLGLAIGNPIGIAAVPNENAGGRPKVAPLRVSIVFTRDAIAS